LESAGEKIDPDASIKVEAEIQSVLTEFPTDNTGITKRLRIK
jgi:hypothetical protein